MFTYSVIRTQVIATQWQKSAGCNDPIYVAYYPPFLHRKRI
jgi:hypothetical protein